MLHSVNILDMHDSSHLIQQSRPDKTSSVINPIIIIIMQLHLYKIIL